MKLPRKLSNDEIMVKVDHCTETEVTLVLYTKPTVVTRLMDETYGSGNWQCEHTVVSKGNGQIAMVCKVGVYDEEANRWVYRSDVGEPIGEHSDKSQATDSLKRACALFGVARELKTMPEPIVCRAFKPQEDENGNPVKVNGFQATTTLINITKEEDGRITCRDSFSIVQYLTDDDGNISALCIKDENTKQRVYIRDFRSDTQSKSLSVPDIAIAPLSSSELARFSLMKADVGAFAKKGMTLGQLQPDELRWLFGNTNSADIKRGCLELAEAIPEIKEFFLKGEINPDQLLKNYR